MEADNHPITQKRLRIYEMGISYYGRTYADGKKISARDGWRAIYCLLKYNMPRAPVPVQLLFYLFIGGFSAIVNLLLFLKLHGAGVQLFGSVIISFLVAALYSLAGERLVKNRHSLSFPNSAPPRSVNNY